MRRAGARGEPGGRALMRLRPGAVHPGGPFRTSTVAVRLWGIFLAILIAYAIEWTVYKQGHPLAHHFLEPTNYALGAVFINAAIITVWWLRGHGGEDSLGIFVYGIGITAVLYLIPSVLAFLATNGAASAFWTAYNVGAAAYPGAVDTIEDILIFLVTLLLFAFPPILHGRKGWREAPESQKNTVLRWLVVAASLITGVYSILLYFALEPVRKVPLNQLCVAVLFVVLILAPIYRSVVKSLSERGVRGAYNPISIWTEQKQAANMLLIIFGVRLAADEVDRAWPTVPRATLEALSAESDSLQQTYDDSADPS